MGVCTVKISPEQEQVNLPIGYAIETELFLPELKLWNFIYQNTE